MTSTPVEKSAVRKVAGSPKLDSAAFLEKAQQIVLDNFNAHRKPEKVPELLLSEINVDWFARVMGGWRCAIGSTVAKGLLWRVTYASARDEVYLDVFTKLNNVKISLAEEKAA